MAQLSFKFLPSKESCDHQVRLLIDDIDVLMHSDEPAIGIDPPDFFRQPALRTSGEILIGRCTCGEIGCGDVGAVVTRTLDTVELRLGYPAARTFVFDRLVFDQVIANASDDTSWETVERTAERLVSALDYSCFTRQGFIFQWASGRGWQGKIVLSFFDGKKQRLLHIPWNHLNPNDAVAAVQQSLNVPPGPDSTEWK